MRLSCPGDVVVGGLPLVPHLASVEQLRKNAQMKEIQRSQELGRGGKEATRKDGRGEDGEARRGEGSYIDDDGRGERLPSCCNRSISRSREIPSAVGRPLVLEGTTREEGRASEMGLMQF